MRLVGTQLYSYSIGFFIFFFNKRHSTSFAASLEFVSIVTNAYFANLESINVYANWSKLPLNLCIPLFHLLSWFSFPLLRQSCLLLRGYGIPSPEVHAGNYSRHHEWLNSSHTGGGSEPYCFLSSKIWNNQPDILPTRVPSRHEQIPKTSDFFFFYLILLAMETRLNFH